MNPFLNDTDGVLPSNASETALTDYDGMSTLPICLYLTVTAVATVQAWVNCTNASDDNGICVSRQCYILNFVFFLSLPSSPVILPWNPYLGILPRHPGASVALNQYGEPHYIAMNRQQSYLESLQQERRVNGPSQFQVR